MKQYELHIECYGSDFEHVALKESDIGSVVKYEDAARIIAQRDRLAEALNEIRCAAADSYLSDIANRALSELDKEKQS